MELFNDAAISNKFDLFLVFNKLGYHVPDCSNLGMIL